MEVYKYQRLFTAVSANLASIVEEVFIAELGESAGEEVLSAQDVLRMLSEIATGKNKQEVAVH